MADLKEKTSPGGGVTSGSVGSSTRASSQDGLGKTQFYDPMQESRMTRLGLTLESFKRAPGTTGGIQGAGAEAAMHADDNPMLQQKMKPRHLHVGGSIGTGLFVGSGSALASGGPAGVLIAWIIIGVMLINVTQALGEMAILYPLNGGIYKLITRFVDPTFGFALGWNYIWHAFIVLPLEITVAAQTVAWWPAAAEVPVAVWITVFWIAIVIVSVFGTLGYAEEEFWTSLLKLTVVVMFIFIGIICNCGGGPSDGVYNEYIGGRYWSDPGAFNAENPFKGVCTVFVTAAFSFAGTEHVGIAASETPNPRKTMPSAVKQTFWRITLVYITSLTIIGLLIPYTYDRLLGGSGATASPFVIVMDRAGIPGIPHLINVTICISVLSIGMSQVFAGSRTLVALADSGFAPKIFAYVDKSSRPLPAMCTILISGAIAYINVAAAGDVVFDWLVSLAGLSTLLTWGAICLAHIRFRMAWKAQGHSTRELPFKALGGVWGSSLGFGIVALVLIAQFYVALFPLGGMSDDPGQVAYDFFQEYLSAPVVIAFWIVGFIMFRATPTPASRIDLDTGRKSWLTVEEMDAYRAERATAPMWKKIFRTLFTN